MQSTALQEPEDSPPIPQTAPEQNPESVPSRHLLYNTALPHYSLFARNWRKLQELTSLKFPVNTLLTPLSYMFSPHEPIIFRRTQSDKFWTNWTAWEQTTHNIKHNWMLIVSRCFTLHHTTRSFSVGEMKLTNTASTCGAVEECQVDGANSTVECMHCSTPGCGQ
jgi:hypothetical protein